MLKLHFMIIYSTPNISYSSPYHILLHPFGIPHTALSLFELLLSAITSAPLSPFIGAPVWLMSYPRATKYWEREYKTIRKGKISLKFIEYY